MDRRKKKTETRQIMKRLAPDGSVSILSDCSRRASPSKTGSGPKNSSLTRLLPILCLRTVFLGIFFASVRVPFASCTQSKSL